MMNRRRRKSMGAFSGGGAGSGAVDVVFLSHLDIAAPVDTSSYGHVLTLTAGAVLDTGVKVYGAGSIAITGTGRVTVPDSDAFNMAGGDFTMEGWIEHNTGTHPERAFCTKYNNGQKQWQWGQNNGGGSLQSVYSTTGDDDKVMLRTRPAAVDNVWYHVAVSRNGADLYMYQDGVVLGAVFNAGSDVMFNSTAEMWLSGRQHTTNIIWNGNLDDWRITRGLGRYPDGTSFTPPTEAYPDP